MDTDKIVINAFNKYHEVDEILQEKFNEKQISEIIKGIRQLSIEEILIFAKTDFNNLQMREIRMGFAYGFSIDQIKQYAIPSNTAGMMKDALDKLIIEKQR